MIFQQYSSFLRFFWLFLAFCIISIACSKEQDDDCKQCPLGLRRCAASGMGVEVCKKIASTGCLQWVLDRCKDNLVCVDRDGRPECDDPVSGCSIFCVEGMHRCEGETSSICRKDPISDCPQWFPQDICPANKPCNPQTGLCEESSKCIPKDLKHQQRCVGNDLYWFDDCGNQGAIAEPCVTPKFCQNSQCVDMGCQPKNEKYEKKCVNNVVYWHDDCGNRVSVFQVCQAPQTCEVDKCVDHGCQPKNPQKEQRCVGNVVYWFDDCGNQGTVYQNCQPNQKCENARCIDIGCQPKDPQKDRRCVGNAVYWFDDCGNQGTVYQNCQPNQKCENAQCIDIGCQPQNPQKERRCVGNAVHWFDDCGNQGNIIEVCQPPNICQQGNCVNNCQDQCTLGHSQCAGSMVQLCTRNVQTGCTEWGTPFACQSKEICQNGACVKDPAQNVPQCRVDSLAGSCKDDTDCCPGQSCKNVAFFGKFCTPCTSNFSCPVTSSGTNLECCTVPVLGTKFCAILCY